MLMILNALSVLPQKSLPLLRQALYTKELVIEGIKPPPQHVLGLVGLSQQLPVSQSNQYTQ